MVHVHMVGATITPRKAGHPLVWDAGHFSKCTYVESYLVRSTSRPKAVAELVETISDRTCHVPVALRPLDGAIDPDALALYTEITRHIETVIEVKSPAYLSQHVSVAL